jgi:thiamine phosphate synthase YjbQ (UPF0047 family)
VFLAVSLDLKIYRLGVESPGYTAIDVTEHVRRVVSESGMLNGLVLVYSKDVGCAVIEIEYEPGLLADLEELLKRIGCLDTKLCDAVLGKEVQVLVVNGELFLGQFKRVVLVDVSRVAGEKELVVALEGEFKSS